MFTGTFSKHSVNPWFKKNSHLCYNSFAQPNQNGGIHMNNNIINNIPSLIDIESNFFSELHEVFQKIHYINFHVNGI